VKKGRLTVHMRSHLGIKPYQCTYTSCTKRFHQKQHLRTHLASHVRPQFGSEGSPADGDVRDGVPAD
jgi:hypothetical protein